eukprot:2480309-Pyramimonas_sp.AAC.1
MLYRTELFDVFVLAQRNTTVLSLSRPRTTIGASVLVELTLAKGVFYALDALVNGVLCACQIDVIDVLGREQAAARLELLAIGRGSAAETSRCPSER